MIPFGSWSEAASAAAFRALREFRADVVLSMSTPFDSHLTARAVRVETGIPWIASFSDPWPSGILPQPYCKAQVPGLLLAQLRMLRSVLGRSDGIHMPTAYAIDLVERASGFRITQKSCTIPHIAHVAKECNNLMPEGRWLAHVGDLSRERSTPAVIEGVVLAGKALGSGFKGLLCLGTICSEFRSLVRKMHAEQWIRMEPARLTPDVALSVCATAEALLVIEAEMPSSPFLPSKFPDYVSNGRPTIAVTPIRSAMRDYLNDGGGGCAVRHDAREIATAICSVFSDQSTRSLKMDGVAQDYRNRFLPQTIGLQYDTFLRSVCTVSRKPLVGQS